MSTSPQSLVLVGMKEQAAPIHPSAAALPCTGLLRAAAHLVGGLEAPHVRQRERGDLDVDAPDVAARLGLHCGGGRRAASSINLRSRPLPSLAPHACPCPLPSILPPAHPPCPPEEMTSMALRNSSNVYRGCSPVSTSSRRWPCCCSEATSSRSCWSDSAVRCRQQAAGSSGSRVGLISQMRERRSVQRDDLNMCPCLRPSRPSSTHPQPLPVPLPVPPSRPPPTSRALLPCRKAQ